MLRKTKEKLSSLYVSITTATILAMTSKAYAAGSSTSSSEFKSFVGKIVGVIVFLFSVGIFIYGMFTAGAGLMALKKGREGMGGGGIGEGLKKIGIGILAMSFLPLVYLLYKYLWGDQQWTFDMPVKGPEDFNPF